MSAAALACAALAGSHSADAVTVWHGEDTPAKLCGRHAQNLAAADYAAMRAAGTI